jgi:hypothetical protein
MTLPTIYQTDDHWPEGIPTTAEHPYIGFSPDTTPAEAAARIAAKYGTPPDYVVIWRDWLLAPIPNPETKP